MKEGAANLAGEVVPISEAPAPPLGVPRAGFLRRRWRWVLFLGVPLLVIGGLGLRARSQRSGEVVDKALVAVSKKGDLEVTVLETGRIEPRAQAQVKSRVGGQVVQVTVEEGEKVKVGQGLLRLEPTDYQREVARGEAEVEQERLAAEYAALQLRRAEKAQAGAIAPQAELDQARHEAAQARAKLEAGKVGLATARDRLRYTSIEAPIAGTVTQRGINPGEVVVPGVTSTFEGKPLMVIADLSTLLVKIDLNQIDVAKVRLGQKADVTVDALPGKKYTASVTKVAPAAVAPTHGQQGAPDVFPVEATLGAQPGLEEIKPGMTADVRILVETHKDVLTLPIEAVVTTNEKSQVTLIEGGEGTGRPAKAAGKRDVKVGARNDRELEITAGLKPGERVLIKPPPPSEAKF
jgi:RND family efflux transporter MFP subunit